MKITSDSCNSINGIHNLKIGIYKCLNSSAYLLITINNPIFDEKRRIWPGCYLLHDMSVPTAVGWAKEDFIKPSRVIIDQ